MVEALYDPVTGFPLWFPEELRYKRHISMKDVPKVPEGHCKWCGNKIISKRRRCWCSSECTNEMLIRVYSNTVARRVLERDSGICAVCGIDTLEVHDLMRHSYRYKSAFIREAKIDWGPWYCSAYRYRFWEADHIVPVSMGGGCCGLQNYRTLCRVCHKRETADLSRVRSGATKFLQMRFDF